MTVYMVNTRGLYHAPVIPARIRWNHFWQGALPKLPFRGPVIPVELSHSGIETGMVLEWTGMESGRMQLNRFIYLFILQLYFLDRKSVV